MQTTRQRILEILKEKRQATVDQLSEKLELTPVTVRHHLEILRAEGLIGAPVVLRRPGPGRPQHTYALTEAAGDLFPRNYHNLADFMFDEMRERLTEAELQQMMDSIAGRMASGAPTAKPEQKPQELLNTIVGYLNDQGYVARWEKNADGDFLLSTCNCPYERVAHAHSEVCQIDANFVGQLVGVAPTRTSHMASGADSCSNVLKFEEKHASE